MMACLRAGLLLLSVLLLGSVLGGCAVSRQNVREANDLISASIDHRLNCDAADHCAMASSLLALGDKASDQSRDGHPVNYAVLLDHGEDALIARLNLIRAARHSIDIQTYIWVDDDAGNLVVDELVRAARRGVRVRVLADQLASFNNIEQLAELARAHVNFQLRLYNPTLHAAETGPFGYVASAACCFWQTNQRMHNKLLLVDDRVGITGGRNYEDRYYDWDDGFDFRDRDVLVAGPVAKQMASSFAIFWMHPRAAKLAHLRDVNARLRADGPGAPGWQPPHYDNNPRTEIALAAALTRAYVTTHFVDIAFKLGQVSYFADLPDKTDDPNRVDSELTSHLMSLVSETHHEVVLQTPYLLLSKKAQQLFRRLHHDRPEVQVTVSTNSLASTDAFAVYALYHKYKRRYLVPFGFNIYEMKPHPQEAPELIANFDSLSGIGGQRGSGPDYSGEVPLSTEGVRISLHAKSMVVDSKFVMIGSHNFDPRSDHYNTESGIIVDDPVFATAVRASILRDTEPGNAWVIAKREADSLLTRVNRAIAKLSAELPIFDFWPFRYATSYALKPGREPVLRTDPRFFDNYEPVGEFPEVALPFKVIYTRIMTAFGSGMSGML